MVELVSEPLYILAQVRLQLQVRVVAEAAATLVRGILTLTLLKTGAYDVGIALSLAQVHLLSITQAAACIPIFLLSHLMLQPQPCLCHDIHSLHAGVDRDNYMVTMW